MSSTSADQSQTLDTQAVKNFREYLQIPSVHPDINYDGCVQFLEKQAKSLDLQFRVVIVSPGKPVVILTWKGKNLDLPSVMLNSHMDVVPVYEDKWTQKPFGADIVDGKIYGRGSQDMKCVGIWYLEAIRRLKLNNISVLRTIHVVFVPDEEIGGNDGMMKFVESKEFRELKVGVCLDEGMGSVTEEIYLFYDERLVWQMEFVCPGVPMHGALLADDTAGEKIAYILQKIYEFRAGESKKLKELKVELGDVTTINLTKIEGGIHTNVLPAEIKCTVDCRVTPNANLKEFEEMVKNWASKAGTGAQLNFIKRQTPVGATKLDNTNPYWIAFKKTTDELNLKVKPIVCPGRTDGSYLRSKGVPVFGFSPINNSPILLHQNDEFLYLSTFLKGIDYYYKIIQALANAK